MKKHMWKGSAMDYLFDHILDGFKSSHEGIERLKENQLISDEELNELLKMNSKRLIDRIKEFKIEQKLFGIFFACLFSWMQVSGEDLEMRRPSRPARASRSARSGRRSKDDCETITL